MQQIIGFYWSLFKREKRVLMLMFTLLGVGLGIGVACATFLSETSLKELYSLFLESSRNASERLENLTFLERITVLFKIPLLNATFMLFSGFFTHTVTLVFHVLNSVFLGFLMSFIFLSPSFVFVPSFHNVFFIIPLIVELFIMTIASTYGFVLGKRTKSVLVSKLRLFLNFKEDEKRFHALERQWREIVNVCGYVWVFIAILSMVMGIIKASLI